MLVYLILAASLLVLVLNTISFTKAVSMVARSGLLKWAEKRFSLRLTHMHRTLILCTCLAVLKSMTSPSSAIGPLCMEILVVSLQTPLTLSTWSTLLRLRLVGCPLMKRSSSITTIVFGLLLSLLEVALLPLLLILVLLLVMLA